MGNTETNKQKGIAIANEGGAMHLAVHIIFCDRYNVVKMALLSYSG